ncbi:MAG: hypothetical protein AAB414_00120 [Patescibacteria group bacterium]
MLTFLLAIEILQKEMRQQFPYWAWYGEPRSEDASTYLERAWEYAEDGNTGNMDAMVAMALRTSNAPYLNAEEIKTMRVHGYGIFIHNTLGMLFELEDTYDERCNDKVNIVVMLLIDPKSGGTTVTPEERAETMVNTSKQFSLDHLTLLNHLYPQVETAEHKLDELLS